MKYYLCQYGNKISEHASEHALELALEKSQKKEAYGIIVPELEIGTKVATEKGYYGEVILLSDNLIHIKRPKDSDPIDSMVLERDKFETLFIRKIFTIYKE